MVLNSFHMPHGTLAFSSDYVDMAARGEFMAEFGITRQVLSFPGLFGLDSLAVDECFPLIQLFNDDVARWSKAHPEQFSGLAALPMADIDLAVSEYKRARHDLGLIGAILPNNTFVSNAHAARLAPIFDVAQDIGGRLFIHLGRRPDEVPAVYNPAAAPRLDHAMQRQALQWQNHVAQCMVTLLFGDFLDPYPDVSLHVANLGGTLPMVIEHMDNVVLTRTPGAPLPSSRANRVHVDCSSLGPRALEIAVAVYGADRMVFGSDCPIFSTETAKATVANARISEADRQAIRSGNAATLLSPYGSSAGDE
jgi:predicted TIM-barrel fold metal-dependent hydrolase